MPIFDEAAAVEAMARGIAHKLFHGTEAFDIRRPTPDHVATGLAQAALAALKPFLGGCMSKHDALRAIPTSWLDDLLSGPKAVLPKSGEYRGPDIERLLTAIRARIEALPASPDKGVE